MSDQANRELERAAEAGDCLAAERLYWRELSLNAGSPLLDKLIERVLTLSSETGELPSVWEKIAFVRGDLGAGVSADQLEQWIEDHSVIATPDDLHRIPRAVRGPGFTTYVVSNQQVYRINNHDQWEKLVALSAPPPCSPFHVVKTLADRDALSPGAGLCSCLVLANGGIYVSSGLEGPMGRNRHRTVRWRSIRFEKVTRS